MAHYEMFPFTEEYVSQFREKKQIPVDFYNKNGQVLIHKKESASDEEIERLLNFIEQGIYYDVNDSQKLGLDESAGGGAPEGLTDTKLLSEKHTQEMTHDTEKLFSNLKQATQSSIGATKMGEQMDTMLSDFENQQDAMVGLVNILELMSGNEASYEVEMAVKRTVVAMSLKTRGMQAGRNLKERKRMREQVNNLMMGSLLCDIGSFRMEMPSSSGLSDAQMSYVRNHPLMSYLMVAHDPEVNKHIKFNILNHHRPKADGVTVNNYPDTRVIFTKLAQLREKYKGDPQKASLVKDIDEQLMMLKTATTTNMFNEDIAIIALASEFASLTTDVPWRTAFPAEKAVRYLINNSYFTYPYRVVREFLDYLAISLCDNKMIIQPGDFVVLASGGEENNPAVFEVCQVLEVGRFQSRPYVKRLGTISPVIKKSPKLMFMSFDVENLKADPRKAHYDLNHDESRHIVYLIYPDEEKELDMALYEGVLELSKNS